QRPAGWGTPHVGQGRCKLHGGCAHRANLKHGRYVRTTQIPREVRVQGYAQNLDPLNCLGELALARALLQEMLDRYGQQQTMAQRGSAMGESPQVGRPVFPDDMLKYIQTIARIAHIVQTIRDRDGLSRAEIRQVVVQMGQAVEEAVQQLMTPEDW